MLQATAAESHSMRSSAVAAGAVPLLCNVLKEGVQKDSPQPEMPHSSSGQTAAALQNQSQTFRPMCDMCMHHAEGRLLWAAEAVAALLIPMFLSTSRTGDGAHLHARCRGHHAAGSRHVILQTKSCSGCCSSIISPRMHTLAKAELAREFSHVCGAGDITQQAAAMGALQALAVSHMGSPDLQRAWGTADVIPHLCARLRAAALPMRCLAAGALSNFALGCSDATVRAVAILTPLTL